jgi:hypothetical protein
LGLKTLKEIISLCIWKKGASGRITTAQKYSSRGKNKNS